MENKEPKEEQVIYPVYFAGLKYKKLLVIQSSPEVKFFFKDNEISGEELIDILEEDWQSRYNQLEENLRIERKCFEEQLKLLKEIKEENEQLRRKVEQVKVKQYEVIISGLRNRVINLSDFEEIFGIENTGF